MKKKLLSLILALAMLTVLAPTVTFAATSGTCGDNVTWVLDDDGTLTISGTGNMTNQYSASSVPWYNSRTEISSVIIEYGVTNIGMSAFSDCSNLVSVDIPSSVTGIGTGAFYDCSGLTNIDIPNSVTSIGNTAFCGCSGLTSIDIPSSVTSIGSSAFSGCSGLTSIDIPSSVTDIEYSAFSGCTDLADISIADNTVTIGSSAFYNTAYYNCSDNWENDILYIGNHLIEANTELSGTCDIRESTVTLAESSFSGCASLTDITIPSSVAVIGSNAFSACTGLTEITIPNGVTYIGSQAFAGCSNLTDITILGELEECGAWVFVNTAFYNDPDNWEDGVLYIADILLDSKDEETIDVIDVKEGIRLIASSAFIGNSTINTITLPKSLTIIGSQAFEFSSVRNVYVLSDTINIGSLAFYLCTSLESMLLPKNIDNVQLLTFFSCRQLTIYYGGSEKDWSNLSIDEYGNSGFTDATIYYNAIGTAPPQITNVSASSDSTVELELEDVEYDSTLITVFTKDGVLTDTQTDAISAGDTSKSVDIADGADSVKVFIWDSLEGMKPLCEAKTADIE